MGIDPDFVPDSENPDEESRAGVTSATKTTASASCRDGRAATPAMFCDYCGGKDHPEADCPHRLNNAGESESESESESEEDRDSGNESDM